MKIFVYIAGPYSKGDVAQNIRRTIYIADRLFELGYYPFIPHLAHFWHLIVPRPYEDWFELNVEWLKKCDALIRLPGESPGANREVLLAVSLKIPVFTTLKELEKWRKGKGRG